MAATDPRVEIRERSIKPCNACDKTVGVLVVEISVAADDAGEYSGDLCWDCLREAYEDPNLLID